MYAVICLNFLGGCKVSQNSNFINLFEELKLVCNKIAGSGKSTSFELSIASKKNFIVSRNKRFIEQIRDIRNLLQHPNHDKSYDAFLVNENLVKDLSDLINSLKNAKKAADISIPFKEIFHIKMNSKINDATDAMQKNNFTHLPILDEKNILQGVLSENSLFSYFCSDDLLDAGDDVLVEDLMQFCSMEHRSEVFKFIKPGTTLERVYNLFTGITGPNQRVGALFITASGKNGDPITGMITAWDILSNIID